MNDINWNDWFYYDETSPSCLRWKLPKGRISIGDFCGYKNCAGYWSVMLDGKNILCHRVVYELHNDKLLPNICIDHIDGIRDNNNIENLRAVTKAVNNRNCKIGKNNKSGVQGVYFLEKNSNKYWVAKWRVGVESKQRHKYFNIEELGNENAFVMACNHRLLVIEILNDSGAGYSERHMQIEGVLV